MDDKWIIFDFDGTLADTLEAGLATVNLFAGKYGFHPITKVDLDRLRDLSSVEILKDVGVKLWKLPFLAKAVRKKFAEQIESQKLFPGILEALNGLKGKGYHLAILTTNSEANIAAFVAKNNLNGLFEFIHAESGLFSKGGRLKKLLKKHAINPGQAFYVGDETRDIDAARQAGVKSAVVTWGVNSKTALQAHHPDYLMEKPEELFNIKF